MSTHIYNTILHVTCIERGLIFRT